MAPNDVVRTVEWALLMAQLPGKAPLSAGILLLDPGSDELHIKLLPEVSGADQEVNEFWRELPQHLMERSQAVGGRRVLDWLETSASHLVQLGPCTPLQTANPEEALELLYRRHVGGNDSKAQQPATQAFRRSAAG